MRILSFWSTVRDTVLTIGVDPVVQSPYEIRHLDAEALLKFARRGFSARIPDRFEQVCFMRALSRLQKGLTTDLVPRAEKPAHVARRPLSGAFRVAVISLHANRRGAR
ncbi:hypothetical protein BLAT2472_20009 [Burkholderia latens]